MYPLQNTLKGEVFFGYEWLDDNNGVLNPHLTHYLLSILKQSFGFNPPVFEIIRTEEVDSNSVK